MLLLPGRRQKEQGNHIRQLSASTKLRSAGIVGTQRKVNNNRQAIRWNNEPAGLNCVQAEPSTGVQHNQTNVVRQQPTLKTKGVLTGRRAGTV